MEPGIPRQDFSTMPLITAKYCILKLLYFYYQIEDCNHIYPLDGARADTFDK